MSRHTFDEELDEGGAFFDTSAVDDMEDGSTLAVFEGDEGALSLEQRRCLVNLLKKPLITAQNSKKDWDVLVREERLLRSRLNDLLLNLVIDRERGVAFKVQVRHPVAGMFPPLLHKSTYSREETVLLVFLRQRYASERSAGQDRVYVDLEECLEAIARFRPANASDETGDWKRAKNAVESQRASGVLEKSGQEDRFKVSPVIEVLMPVQELRSLLSWLTDQNRPEWSRTQDSQGVEDDDG